MNGSASEIRALSVRQPWAWAICVGAKEIENRTWSSDYRGTIAIHAANSTEALNRLDRQTGHSRFKRETFATGAIIGLAELVDVASYGPRHENQMFAEGPYCWTLTNARLLQTPIPLKGRLNLFRLDHELQEQLRTAPISPTHIDTSAEVFDLVMLMMPEPDPITSYEALFQESVATGLHQDALPICGQRLIELAPERASGYLILGASLLSEPESKGCIELLKKAAELAPDHALSWYFLTDAYLREAQHDLAFQAAEEAMRQMPDNAMAFENRGRVHFFADRFEEAIADLNLAIEMQPNDAGSIAMRAECRSKLAIALVPWKTLNWL